MRPGSLNQQNTLEVMIPVESDGRDVRRFCPIRDCYRVLLEGSFETMKDKLRVERESD